MHELSYCSTSNNTITQIDINNILNTANTFNKENNITGCLLYYKNEFVQWLEGEKSILLDLFKLIKKDDLHNHVIRLLSSNKDKQDFGS